MSHMSGSSASNPSSVRVASAETMSDDWYADYSMCVAPNQSPIDIVPYDVVVDHDLCDATFDWDIDFSKQTFKISNTGYTVTLKAAEETEYGSSRSDFALASDFMDSDGTDYVLLTDNEQTIGKLPNYLKPQSSEHSQFCLDSIDMHWGLTDDTGSEHTLDGHHLPLELHFVHYSCAHANLASVLQEFASEESVTNATNAGVDPYQLGVVALLFDVVEDATNPGFDAILSNDTVGNIMFADQFDGQHASDIVHDLDLSQLIPDNVWTAGYYAYEGSLTNPPCTNIVRWFVMNGRGYIGRSQLELLRDFMASDDETLAPNYREVQDNLNAVYSCTGETDSEDYDYVAGAGDEVVPWWAIALMSVAVTVMMMSAAFGFIYRQFFRNRGRPRSFSLGDPHSPTELELNKRQTQIQTACSDVFDFEYDPR